MIKGVFTAIVTTALALPTPASAIPVNCAAMIAGHIAWMGSINYPHRRIGARFARVKITSGGPAPSTGRWGHVSVAEGAFGWHGTDMQGRFMVAFSDRGFDPNRRDITDITLWADGRGQIMLRSWGNAVLPLTEMRCDSAGFLSAIEREGNGTSMITLSFRRETF
jgi:hypothetical protein